jgi:serine protease Do
MTETIHTLRSRSPRRALLAALLFVGVVSASAGLLLDRNLAADTDQRAIANVTETGQAFAAVTREVGPAVVYIRATRQHVMTSHQPGMDSFRGQIPDDLLKRFFGERLPEFPMPQQPQQRPMVGEGSGFVISKDGYILTNNHVVGGAEKLEVLLHNGERVEAKVIGTDKRTDVALIKVDADDLPVLRMGDSDALEVGEWVLAIGSPFGLTGTVTAGIVSAKGRDSMGITDYENFIQTDAAINPGNSGGPLVNLRGEAVGINTAIISRGGGHNGIGFAIPMNMVRQIYEQLREHGSVTRGFLGIVIQPLTPELAQSFGLSEPAGVLIGDLNNDGPAAAAGLMRGDVIVSLDGEPVKDVTSFRNRVAMIQPDTTVNLEVLRDGDRRKMSVKIGSLPSEVAVDATERKALESEWGMSVQTIDPQLAEQLKVEPNGGVVVTTVDPNSPAAAAGIRPGTIIRQVNRQDVANAADFARAIGELNDADSLLLLVEREGRTQYVAVKKTN